jgi:hypothetical protein
MSTFPAQEPTGAEATRPTASRDDAWAKPITKLSVTDVPSGAIAINVQGRQVISPLQGFGQLWQKTYRVRLPGLAMTPVQVMQVWKAEFPAFQPSDSQFYPPMTGIEPGKVIFINLNLPIAPGMPNLIPVDSGVMVLYADDEMFTVMTPEGFPLAGWNTFSVSEEEGSVIAQIQSMERSTDPIFELGNILMGGARRQEENWVYVLTSLAARFGIKGQVQMHRELIDPRWQWSEARNVWQNAGVRTVLYKMAAPLRWVRRLFTKR